MKTPSQTFRLVSENGDGMGFAIRLKQLGYGAVAWVRSPDAKSIGDRIVDKEGDLEDLIRAATPEDVFVFDTTGNGTIADHLRARGFAVLGGGSLMDRLERDRQFGYSVMEECHIDVPATYSFNDFGKAINFVEQNPDVRWVYKPSKQLGDVSSSHVSYDAEDLVELLESVELEVDISDPQFELQAFEKGIAMSTELWFQNGELIDPLTNHTLERKEVMNDDIGPSGGCAGNVVWVCDGCAVCDVAKRLVPWCEAQRYHGMLDLNAIVTKDVVYGLEFTPRFGYDAAPTFLWELLRSDLGDFMRDLARGTLRDVDVSGDVIAGALKVSIPPWPTERHIAEENVPIRGLANGWEDETYLYNVKWDKDNQLVSAGAWGILMLLTHRAGTISGAMRQPLTRAKDLKIKNKQFRTDLAERFKEDLDVLESNNIH